MQTFSLNSGSNGNCFYFESDNTRIIVEAGLNCKQYEKRLMDKGILPSSINAVLVSHEHSDHICGISVIQKKYGTPIYMTHQTKSALPEKFQGMHDIKTFSQGESFGIGCINVQTLPSQHDCKGGAHFILDDNSFRMAVVTDLGSSTNLLHAAIGSLDLLYMESNYDPKMLNDCNRYPQKLKDRISGDYGHLSNLQSAQIIRYYASEKLKHLILCHLSANANTTHAALATHKKLHSGSYKISVADRDNAMEMITLQSKTLIKNL